MEMVEEFIELVTDLNRLADELNAKKLKRNKEEDTSIRPTQYLYYRSKFLLLFYLFSFFDISHILSV